jgi:carbon storage regulator CsrA
MLVLTRKLQQQIKIGEQVTITILRVKGQTVRVGIEAPRDVRVIRGELPSGSDLPGGSHAAAGEETVMEETTLVLTGGIEEGESGDEGAHDEASALDEATAPRRSLATVNSPPAVPRLPQRKRFNRAGSPPLRVAMATASPSLAK